MNRVDKENKIALRLTLIVIPILLVLFVLCTIFPPLILVLLALIMFGVISFSIYMMIFNFVDQLDFDTLEKFAKFFGIKDKEGK